MNFEDFERLVVDVTLGKDRIYQGSQIRYKARQAAFEEAAEFDEKTFPSPWLKHQALWWLHNLVAHPILAFSPTRKAVEIHELTSRWLNLDDVPYRGKVLKTDGLPNLPEIPNRRAWILHNLVAHVGIGLFPCKLTFEYHDKTAEEMQVPGWV